jgi:hypothetical protein
VSWRSPERFAPFFRRIHIVVDGAPPEWLDTAAPEIHIVGHPRSSRPAIGYPSSAPISSSVPVEDSGPDRAVLVLQRRHAPGGLLYRARLLRRAGPRGGPDAPGAHPHPAGPARSHLLPGPAEHRARNPEAPDPDAPSPLHDQETVGPDIVPEDSPGPPAAQHDGPRRSAVPARALAHLPGDLPEGAGPPGDVPVPPPPRLLDQFAYHYLASEILGTPSRWEKAPPRIGAARLQTVGLGASPIADRSSEPAPAPRAAASRR